MVFTAFVTDVCSRRIMSWRTASRMPNELPLDTLEMVACEAHAFGTSSSCEIMEPGSFE